MKIRIRIETEFGWGEKRSHDLDAVEDGAGAKGRFALCFSGADHPLEYMRTNLAAARWREVDQVDVLSDGEPAPPRPVRHTPLALT